MPLQLEHDRRVYFLEQQVKDLEQHLRSECESSVKTQFQLMQQVADLKKTLQLKEQTTNYLNQQLNETLSAYRAQRQRADKLQLEIGSSTVQNQREQALRELIKRQVQQIREQQQRADQLQLEIDSKAVQDKREQALKKHIQKQEQQIRELQAALSESTSRLIEQQKTNERLQTSIELLEMRSEDENVLLEDERAHLGDQLESSDEALQIGTEVQAPMASTNAGEYTDQVLSERLNEQLREFEQERAQLLEQASDAVAAQQEVIMENRSCREAVLTCPISSDLLVDRVVTACCGKTFSSRALMRSFEQNPICPSCHETEVHFHPNQDMSILVQLHRSESSSLANVSHNEPACIDDAVTSTEQIDVPAGLGRRSRRGSDDLSTQPRHQGRRSQRDPLLLVDNRPDQGLYQLEILQQRLQVMLKAQHLVGKHVFPCCVVLDIDLKRC
ncbi:hypothetical protein F443_02110 [Phytophthora nicotianae P1569]|uniref:SP-RING-type domain-containing protein n=1 Tax=Phytophthora nicotianae P1569 TaxID=1317065 RepID=V9FVV2_PHYNI|nr:hypothetical protein F443_02110 [Phytophthora nicotianae P1569]